MIRRNDLVPGTRAFAAEYWFLRLFALVALVFASADCAIVAQSKGVSVEITFGDGNSLDANFISLGNGELGVETENQPRTFKIDSVSRIRFIGVSNNQSEPSSRVTLLDGSFLNCQQIQSDVQKLTGKTACGIPFEFPSRMIDHMLLNVDDPRQIAQWNSVAKRPRESDAVVVERSGELQTIDGIINSIDSESISFTVGERTADVKKEKVFGLQYYRRSSAEIEAAKCVLTLNDQSRLNLRSIDHSGADLLAVTGIGIPVSVSISSIDSIDFTSDRFVWLSDLDPATNDWIPLMSGSQILPSLKQFSIARINEGFAQRPLALLVSSGSALDERKTYQKGFSIKGGGKLSFLIGKQYRRLTGLVGFDPTIGSGGSAKLTIQVDGKNRIEQVFDATKVADPVEINVDLNGAERIVFLVDYHDRRSVGDVLNAVDMKLHR